MIGFVVPVKPKSVSKNWDYDNLLLSRTVKSICAQKDQKFKLIIVYNDLPEINYKHENIFFEKFPFNSVSADSIEDLDYVLKYYKLEYAEKMLDKGKKIHYGCKKAIDLGCDYLMGVDSDDLVSNKLAKYVNENLSNSPPGWRIKKGFIYEENSCILIKKYDIQNINGSTHIIRKDLITIPDFNRNLFWDFNLFEAHGYTYGRIKDFHNELLIDCPLWGVIYVVHKNNYSNILFLTSAINIKNIIKKLIRGKILSIKIRKEYGLFSI